MSSDAALLQEIQRLSGAIDRHKLKEAKPRYAPRLPQSHNYYVNSAISNRTYINPAIAHKKYVNGSVTNKHPPPRGFVSGSSSESQFPVNATRELVIDGVAFESSSRKLTRKDLITNNGVPSAARPQVNFSSPSVVPRQHPSYVRKGGNLVSSSRIHKPKFSMKGRRSRGRHNMVLNNVLGTRAGHMAKRRKTDKQCRFFTMTGVCQRGLTCPYQHDPEKIAICPLFLSSDCPNSADTCHLSHDPTPSRVPLCHHFANHGRCTRDNCPYPHVRVGPRNGVCRDFAVVGYCDKGIDCDKQHVRECPDFAEKGVCPNSACKLPHVIRANRRRQSAMTTSQAEPQMPTQSKVADSVANRQGPTKETNDSLSLAGVLSVPSSKESTSGAAEEYISLTFEESDDDDDSEEEEEEEEEMAQDAEGSCEEQESNEEIVN